MLSLAPQAPIVPTTISRQLVSATTAPQASIARLAPRNSLATATKDISALAVNQRLHQPEFSILLRTQTVCLANVLLVITAQWELRIRFHALQVTSKTN
jgi:hypothetical protein